MGWASALRSVLRVRVVCVVLGAISPLMAVAPVLGQPTGLAETEFGLKSAWCPSCEVRITEVLVLGDEEGPGVLEDDVVRVRRDSRGRYYLMGSFSQSVQVFRPDGGYVATVGRKGQGPGEFRGIADMVVDEGDTLYAFDLMNGTLSVFDPDHEFVRTARLEIPPSVFVEAVGRGRFVFSSWVRTRDRIGYPLHLVNSEGRVEASFGSETGEFRPDLETMVRLASAGPGRVWAGVSHRYALELWDAFEGRKLRELRREVDWFPPGSPDERWTADTPPPPSLGFFAEDGRGWLWVPVSVADPRWRDAVEVAEDRVHLNVTDPVRYRDMVLEILDTESGEALASLRFDRGFGIVDAREGLIGSNVIDERLVSRYKIYRLELVPCRGGTRNRR